MKRRKNIFFTARIRLIKGDKISNAVNSAKEKFNSLNLIMSRCFY